MKKTTRIYCECSDPGCPECQGNCSHQAFETLYRIDMEDETGTRFCDQCSADAMDSGVFTNLDPMNKLPRLDTEPEED